MYNIIPSIQNMTIIHSLKNYKYTVDCGFHLTHLNIEILVCEQTHNRMREEKKTVITCDIFFYCLYVSLIVKIRHVSIGNNHVKFYMRNSTYKSCLDHELFFSIRWPSKFNMSLSPPAQCLNDR